MAKIRIYRYEAGAEDMPRMCMKCGAETDDIRPQNFAWMPAWVHVFLFIGLLPWLIAALVTRKTMEIDAPMCPRHANHWLYRKLYVWLGLLWWIAYAIGVGVASGHVGNDVLYPMVGVLLFGFLSWLVVGLFLMNGAIRAAEIRDTGMELVHVHPDFAWVWRRAQDERRAERRAERRRRADPVRPAPSAKPWDRGPYDAE